MDCIKSQNQCLNTILFPGKLSQSTYNTNTYQDLHHLTLLYIPFKRKNCPISTNYLYSAPDYIPALLSLSHSKTCQYFCIHFHGNACDIGQISICAGRESQAFNAHYLIVEYPAYGISHGSPNEVVFNEIALAVHEFITETLHIPSHQIVIIGRSIGTGPACFLAGHLQSIGKAPFALMLQSPFASINDAASDLLGGISCCLINRWENHYYLVNDQQLSSTIKCPVLFIHADQDKIINISHSQTLHEQRLKLGLLSSLYIQKSDAIYIKGHNYFDYEKDVVQPMKKFLIEHYYKYQEILAQKKMNPLEEDEDKVNALSFTIPLPMNKDTIKRYSMTPDSYIPKLPKSAFGSTKSSSAKEQLWNSTDVYYEEKKPYCSSLDIIGWTCCPCFFCMECSFALTCNVCNECMYCLFPFTKPIYQYSKLRPSSVQQGSIYSLIFRNKTFLNQINEEDSSKSHSNGSNNHVIEDKPARSSKRRMTNSPRNEVKNPLFSSDVKTDELPSSNSSDVSSRTHSIGTANGNSNSHLSGLSASAVDEAMKLGRENLQGRKGSPRSPKSSSITAVPTIVINSREQPPSIARTANASQAAEEDKKRSVNSPSEARRSQDVVVNQEDEEEEADDADSSSNLFYVPG